MRWFRVALHTVFGICGQTSAALLTRLYYEKGGKSKWVATLVQLVGFPLLLPFYYCISRPKVESNTAPSPSPSPSPTSTSSLRDLLFVYIFLGLIMGGNGYLHSVAYEYLPVSTMTLISASQLAFSAFFSYLLNSQKFTPFIINSLVLLTISSVLLVANNNTEKPAGVSKGQYAAGLICTIFGAAMVGLLLNSQQLACRKVIKKETIKAVLELIICQSFVAFILTLIGFFVTGDYKGLETEMEEYELGKVSYVMTLVWIAISYQVFSFNGVAIVFEVSALFGNVTGALALPITTIIAMVVFHDKMNGVKGISMVLAVWGYISYIFQQYIDDHKVNSDTLNGNEVSQS